MHYIRRKGWELKEHLVTPEQIFLNRRTFMAGAAGLGMGGAAFGETMAKLNPDFKDAGRPVTAEEFNTTFNNYYEFGASKRISEAAKSLKPRPWTIKIDGLVEAPLTLDIDDLLKQVALEERIYRHRCVEAWAMVVPWTGFALRHLVALAKPTADAKYLRFETFNDPVMAPGQEPGLFGSYEWPYVEGVTLAEAMNDLSFMATGAYGKALPNAMGAPIRLHLPWKYGFKSIKSIVKVSFVKERPISFWENIGPNEYGFWANVNPEVSHPRWSQAEEQMLGSNERVPTQLFNGYGSYVAELYKGMEKDNIYM
jgi:methionine sulfoxide reductase catalytic subunit